MKVLVFTEGTVLIFRSGKNKSRKEAVKMSKAAGVQREERNISYITNAPLPSVKPGSVYDFSTHVPLGDSVEKLKAWKRHGATIMYLTSRRIKQEIDMIKEVLKKYDFPDRNNLYFRQENEDYKDVAERLKPDILIEDDCESIGGEAEMVYPHIRQDLKSKITSMVVKEFGGIDHLPDKIAAKISRSR